MKIHAFIDAKNISQRLFIEGCSRLQEDHELVQIDVFGKVCPKWAAGHNYVRAFVGKNSADTFMTAAIVRAIYEEAEIGGVAIFSHDRDFLPAIKVVTEHKKRVFMVAARQMREEHLKRLAIDLGLIDRIDIDPMGAHLVCHAMLSSKELKKLQAYDMTTCFLKTQSGLLEVPFARGIDMNLFCRLIPLTEIRKGYGKTRKMKDILAESHLCVRQNRVYIDIDRL